MSIITTLLQGTHKLREAWPIINQNFNNTKDVVNGHIAGTSDKHNAQDINYSGSVPGKSNSKDAIDETYERIDYLIEQTALDPGKDPEVIDSRVSAAKSKTFDTVDARFEEIEQDHITHLADSATKMSYIVNDSQSRAYNVKYPPIPMIAAKGNANYYYNGQYYEDEAHTILSTNDTSVFKAIIDYIKNIGGKIIIPEGNYLVNPNEFYAPINVSFEGVGTGISILKLASAGDCFIYSAPSGYDADNGLLRFNSSIKDLSIIGAGFASGGVGIRVVDGYGIEVNNTRITQFGIGIRATSSQQIHITDCEIEANDVGLRTGEDTLRTYATEFADAIKIDNTFFTQNRIGIFHYGAASAGNFSIDNCYWYMRGTGGTGEPNAQKCIVLSQANGVSIESSTFDAGDNGEILGVILSCKKYDGVTAAGASFGINIEGNSFNRLKQSIYVEDVSDGHSFISKGNVFYAQSGGNSSAHIIYGNTHSGEIGVNKYYGTFYREVYLIDLTIRKLLINEPSIGKSIPIFGDTGTIALPSAGIKGRLAYSATQNMPAFDDGNSWRTIPFVIISSGLPDNATGSNGWLAIDMTNGRLCFKYNSVWHYVTQTA